jgi:hypothetical protein
LKVCYLSVRICGLCELIELAFQSQQGLTMTIDHGNDRNIEVAKAMSVEVAKAIVVAGEFAGMVLG